ncbi:MAG TPA: hypothetical protein VM680_02720 [Verrucomicrobiae bacterium]|nr:hypothetical protein [Verrucomicrobiae bacterium]
MNARNLLAASLLTILVLVGCVSSDEKRFIKGAGDLGQFIAQHASMHGARSVATNKLPLFPADWRYFSDTNGVVIRLKAAQFPRIQTLLRQIFGPPDREPLETTDGGKVGWYAAKTIGIGLQFSHDRKNSQIIVIRPQKNSREILIRSAELESQKRR